MKKPILILFLVLSYISLCNAGMIIQKFASGGSSPVSTMLSFITFEGDWTDPVYTTGAADYTPSGADNTWAGNSDVDINATAVKIGSNGLDAPTFFDYLTVVVSSDDLISGEKGVIAFWLYLDTWADSKTIFLAWEADTDRIFITIKGSDNAAELRFVWEDGDVENRYTTTGAAIANDTWVFCEFIYDMTKTAGSDEVEIKVDNTSRYSSSALSLSPLTAITKIEIGSVSTSATGDNYIDNYMVFDDPTANAYQYRNDTTYPTE